MLKLSGCETSNIRFGYRVTKIFFCRQTCLICIISGISSVLIGLMIFAYIGHAVHQNSGKHYATDYFKKLITGMNVVVYCISRTLLVFPLLQTI